MKIRPKEGDVYFDVVAVVDPVTRDAQKLAPLLLVGCCRVERRHPTLSWSTSRLTSRLSLLQVLKQLVNVNLRVFMNCQSKLSDMPLKR